MYLTELNDDVISEIFNFLTNDERFIMMYTNKYYYELIINKYKIKFPNLSLIFSNVKYINFFENFDDFMKINKSKWYKLGIKYADDINILLWIYNKQSNKNFNYKLYSYVTLSNRNDKIEILNWLKKMRCPYKEINRYDRVFDIIISRWFTDELLWETDEIKFFDFVKVNINNFDNINWVIKSIPELKQYLTEYAVQMKNKELLDWAIEKNCRLTCNTFANAATNGDFELIKYLYEIKCPVNSWTTTEAVGIGNIQILEWCYSKNIPFESYAYIEATRRNQKVALKWLFDHNCPIDKDTLNML